MYIETVEWWDDLCPESYKAVCHAYNLRVNSVEKIDDFTTKVIIASSVVENLKKFLDDFEDDSFEVLDNLSRESASDEEYIEKLKAYPKKNLPKV